MKQYQINPTAVVEAGDEEAEEIAQAIVNANLDEDLEAKLGQLHDHDGFGNSEFTAVDV